jgi:hypothetical protein
VVWLVYRPLRDHDEGVFFVGLILGLVWDVVLGEPLIGPGGISWSAAALAVRGMASLLVDRSPRAWVAFGALATVVVLVTRWIALLPLGYSYPIWNLASLEVVAFTGLWCGVIGWLLRLDVQTRWNEYRVRRLR